MAFIPKPQFPNVPKLPGVPQLVRASTAVQTAVLPVVGVGLAATRLALSVLAKPVWGIFNYTPPKPPVVGAGTVDPVTGLEELPTVTVTPDNPVIQADTIMRASYTQEYSLPDAPTQDGAFVSYNKVGTPFEFELRLVKVGTLAERAKFLDDCERIGASFALYRIVTPERTYQPVNITSVSFVRDGAEGAYMLREVDIKFKEIRQVTAQYSTAGIVSSTSNAQDPGARPTQNQGTVHAVDPAARIRGIVEKTVAPLRAVSNLLGG
jgi:hypothetical protein